MAEKRFINENHVAGITGLSVQTLRNWRFLGRGIPYVKIGRYVRYPPTKAAVVGMLNANLTYVESILFNIPIYAS